MLYRCSFCRRQSDSTSPEFSTGRCPHCGEELAGEFSGGRIGEFTVLAELGRGNNGVVYLARQQILNREVALKILPPERFEEPATRQAFFRESKVTAKLSHPNIVQAWAAGVTEHGYGFFAMELVAGKSLDDWLLAFGALTYAEALKIGARISDALAYAWEKYGMTHGDIKPGNIIIRQSDKCPKLADLGLAKFANEPYQDEVMATPLYAPPEVINFDFEHMGYKSDIYSFGATLYELFAGEAPFPSDDQQWVLDQHRFTVPEPLKERGCFDPQLSDFIASMLAKNPDDRPEWRDIADFLQQLERRLPHAQPAVTSAF
ncbi:serine/threonine-protein kinase [Victivallis sp. Marseille-Q1083]|uniref:serine/threonine-protein kinase n=1 Tax=Victivallis sp. Marseille-Q1083 TaxID=2717288 RepID=UPI00158F54A7|nr:serine/threonine-protein kinase [Victivallis sp. Marseille-Q1083]